MRCIASRSAAIMLVPVVFALGCKPENAPVGDRSGSDQPTPDTASAPRPVATQPVATQENPVKPTTPGSDKVVKSEDEWRGLLTPEQFYILRQKGTERAFTGKYWNTKDPGVYVCAGCGVELFRSDDKFDSGCGWPSFDKAFAEGRIKEHQDLSHGMVRTEITCARCGGHLGHVFNDGPTATGLRYCVNSGAVNHTPKPPAPPSGDR
jgi:peptide-methionine (R)-S-oxide reductase